MQVFFVNEFIYFHYYSGLLAGAWIQGCDLSETMMAAYGAPYKALYIELLARHWIPVGTPMIILALMVFITFSQVIARYVFHSGWGGALELTQLEFI